MISPSDIDDTAAEYVLGTLSHDERTEVASLRATMVDLDAAIVAWEARLTSLSAATSEALPSADVFSKIQRRLFLEAKAQTLPHPALLTRKIHYWRSVALAASLAFVVVATFMLHEIQSMGPSAQFVAVLQKDTSAPAFLVSLNEKASTLTVSALSGTPPENKSYELWFIANGAKAPRSLGVLPKQNSRLVSLAGLNPSLVRNATLAVSVEPLGGSPTGAPTGPVVFTGKFVQAAL